MKKILFAALAALAITSCSQNEIDGIDNGTPKSKNVRRKRQSTGKEKQKPQPQEIKERG